MPDSAVLAVTGVLLALMWLRRTGRAGPAPARRPGSAAPVVHSVRRPPGDAAGSAGEGPADGHRSGPLPGLPPGLLRRWPIRLARPWVRHATAGLVRVQIFDRSMTLAAQAFTSLFPVLILVAALLGPEGGGRLADLAGLPEISRSVLAESLGRGGISTFGVVGSLAVLVASTGLARALARAYAAVWALPRTPAGPRASWRWFVSVLTLAGFAIVSRLLGWATGPLPYPHLSAAALLLLLDCGIAVLLPWLLLGGAVPARRLAAGGIGFGLAMLALRPIGSLYLPRALASSAERYGTIGVAFTYIGWLYVLAFCVLLTAIAGQVAAEDEGLIGRVVRGPAPMSGGSSPPFMPPG